jgi:putative peptidoglycan binding protein
MSAAFSMKTIRSFLIAGLLLLTRSLDAGGHGDGAGSAFSNPHSSGDARPMARSQQRSHMRVAPARSDQNQINSRNSAIAATPQDRHERHDRDWWRRHFRTIVFVTGGYYYWDGGYWYPALGYDPNYSYDDDDPIYAYGSLLPDQVIANVQTQLQQNGYYFGQITGSIDASTRAAIANYQRDHGLLATATIDQPTVESLGLA